MRKFFEDVGSVRWAIVVVIVGLFLSFMSHAQTITWRLVGSSHNISTNTVTCVYEGRLSNGGITHTTTIVPGFLCPSAPGSSW